ncbi:hypothetical protein JCM10207_007259 [Rhodosporidiobolus poonsookiae]
MSRPTVRSRPHLHRAWTSLATLAGVQRLRHTTDPAARVAVKPFFDWLGSFSDACHQDVSGETYDAAAAEEIDKIRRQLSGYTPTPRGLVDLIPNPDGDGKNCVPSFPLRGRSPVIRPAQEYRQRSPSPLTFSDQFDQEDEDWPAHPREQPAHHRRYSTSRSRSPREHVSNAADSPAEPGSPPTEWNNHLVPFDQLTLRGPPSPFAVSSSRPHSRSPHPPHHRRPDAGPSGYSTQHGGSSRAERSLAHPGVPTYRGDERRRVFEWQ